MLLEQVPEEHGAMNNREQVDDYIDNIIEDDGTNTLIHDSFNVRMDDDDDDDHENHQSHHHFHYHRHHHHPFNVK